MPSPDYAQHLKDIPVAPHIASEIRRLAQEKALSYDTLYQALCVDPGLTVKVLRIANSPHFAREGQIVDLKAALNLIGFTAVKNLVLLSSRSSVVPPDLAPGFYRHFWDHSSLSAFCSRELALMAGFPELSDRAFVGGLLHNLGQVALFRATPSYRSLIEQAETDREPIGRLEEKTLGTTHQEVGYRILETWRFPSVYTDVAREHGQTNITSEHKQTILLVSLGSFIASNVGPRNRSHPLGLVEHMVPYLGLSLTTLREFQESCLDARARDPLFRIGDRTLLL